HDRHSTRFPYTTLFRSTERDLRPPRREVRTNLRPRPCRPPTPRVHRFPPLARSHAPSHVVARPTARARRALDPIPSLVPSPSLRSEEHTSELQSRENLV